MRTLSAEWCVACRRDSPGVTASEIAELRPFPSFADALAFTNRVGALAEDEGHHPALLTEWGRVTVTWWTHKIRGLHWNDFIMVANRRAVRRERTRHTRRD